MHDDNMRETRAKLQNELQQIAEHSGEITADMADRFDALEADIRELDGKIRDADIRGRFDSIKAEPTSKRVAPGAGIETTDGGDTWGAFLPYWRSGGRAAIEGRILNTVNDAAAVPTIVQQEMARKFGEVSGAIQAVRRSALDSKSRVVKVDSRVGVTGITSEGGAFTPTEPTFADVDFSTDQMATATSEISFQMLADASPDMISEIMLQHAEELGRFWSDKICNGLTVGTSQSDGLFDATFTGVNTKTAASASAITAAELTELRYDTLPAEYWSGYGDLGWVMNQDTFAHILGLTDTANGRPLLQPFADSTLAAGFGMTLLGLPVYLDNNAPAFADGTGTTVVALVARNAYRFIERTPGLVSRVNDQAQQSSGIVEVNTFQRGVGRFVRPEACALLSLA